MGDVIYGWPLRKKRRAIISKKNLPIILYPNFYTYIAEAEEKIDVSMVFDYESDSEFATYSPIYNQEDLQKMNVQPNTTEDLDVDICKASKFFLTKERNQ